METTVTEPPGNTVVFEGTDSLIVMVFAVLRFSTAWISGYKPLLISY